MAHSCPICDQYCHCNGDIDDIQLDDTDAQMNCCHCFDEWDEDVDDDDIAWPQEFPIADEDDDSKDPNDSRNL